MIPTYSLPLEGVVEARDDTAANRVTQFLIDRHTWFEMVDPDSASPPPDSTVPRHLARTGIG